MFSIENGLPHNRVNRIYLDAKGFLWVCTDDGLARFDGHRFVNYTMAHGLPHKHANAVLETRNGEFWVATDGGISRFDPRPGRTRFTTYAPAGSDESSHVNALLESSDGSLLVGTSSGLYRFLARAQPPVFERIEFAHSRTASGRIMVNALARDGRGALWLATDDGLYRRKGNAEWAHYGTENGLSADRRGSDGTRAFVNSFAGDRDGRLWIAFKGGFGRISSDPEPGASVLDFVQREQPGLSREVRALWFGSDGRRWVATESAFCEWITDSGGVSSFREHTIQEGLPREAFLSIHEDSIGNLWVGTRRSGLVQVGSSRFHTIDGDEGLRFGLDQLLLQTKSGQVYVFDSGHKTAQLYRWDGGRRFTAIHPALPHLGSTGLQMAMEDDRGAWWFSTASGLFRFSSPDLRFNLRLLPDFEVSRFFEDSVGDIWIAHWPKLARWERRSGVIHDESERLPRDARPGITAFAQDHGGTMWIGLSDGSLLRLIDGKFQPLSANWSGHVNRLFVDSKGRLWATSTESGLGLIDNPQSPDPQVRRFTRAQGLSADEVWSVTEDRLGRIYAGTSRGVDRVDPGTGAIMHYSTADGLVRGDIRSSLRDRNGNLWFASAHGVSRYKPSEDHTTAPARTRITALRIAGIPSPLSEFGEAQIGPLRVPSHQRSLQIDFAATDYRTEAPLRYQFRLDRQGRAAPADGWQDPGMTSTVHLVDLAPGDFTFRVRALGSDGSTGEEATLTFSILQPIWQTWWFQLACAMAIAAIAWWIRTRRLEQQLTLERVRSHIAMDLHDDIGAGLSRISVIGEALKSRLRDSDAEVRKMLDDIAGSSRQLVSDMGEIVWSLDPGHDHVGDLASRLRAFGSDLLETRGVEWNVDAPVESLDYSVPPALRRQFYLVFREAIHNVAKHSGAKRAILRLWLQDGHLWGELADDGCGIQSGDIRGAGIPSMRARVRQSGGQIEISPSAGGGTSVRIRIPLSEYA